MGIMGIFLIMGYAGSKSSNRMAPAVGTMGLALGLSGFQITHNSGERAAVVPGLISSIHKLKVCMYVETNIDTGT